MSKPEAKIAKDDNKEEALEIIELASNEFEALARAFNLITEVLDECLVDQPEPAVQSEILH